MLVTTLGTHYGELPGPPRQKIDSGFYAGIWARPADLAVLDIIRARVNPLLVAEPTIAVIARIPGLIQVTPARTKMLTTFPLMRNGQVAGLEATERFYADYNNRPAIVLIYKDPYFDPLNPFGAEFERWYSLIESIPTPLGTLGIYARN